MKTFNLKLKDEVKGKFKKITKDRRLTMQGVLESFTEMYVEKPDKYRIKMEVIE